MEPLAVYSDLTSVKGNTISKLDLRKGVVVIFRDVTSKSDKPVNAKFVNEPEKL